MGLREKRDLAPVFPEDSSGFANVWISFGKSCVCEIPLHLQ